MSHQRLIAHHARHHRFVERDADVAIGPCGTGGEKPTPCFTNVCESCTHAIGTSALHALASAQAEAYVHVAAETGTAATLAASKAQIKI
ncbi:MAG: hypothetical protein HC853_04185 [Anaerolineae bacterium]|nr:hypothetical protein [Anaerolineae bacterium]